MDGPTAYETLSLVTANIHPAASRDKIIEVCNNFGDHPEAEYRQIIDMLQDALETSGVTRGNWANVVRER